MSKKISNLFGKPNHAEAIQYLKDELIHCADSFEACFVAKDLAELLLESGDVSKAIHYFFLAGEGFVREAEIYQSMAVHCRLRTIEEAKEKAAELKTMISDAFAVASRRRKKDTDANVPIPTPFQEFSASVTFDENRQVALTRNQLYERTDTKFALFSSLKPAELEGLLELAVRKILAPEEILFKEGASSDSFFVVVNGDLLVSNHSGFCKTVGAGEFIGDLSYFAGLNRGVSVSAQAEPAEVLMFTGKKLSELFKRLPNLQERIWHFYERRLFLNVATRLEIFAGLTIEELGVIYDHLLGGEVSEKRPIGKSAVVPDSFYFIVQGQCEVILEKGNRTRLGEGQFIQLENFLMNKITREQVMSKTSMYVLECNRDSYEKLCGLLPQLAENASQLVKKNSVARIAVSIAD
jgi:CRP-like cAMP-binding protein